MLKEKNKVSVRGKKRVLFVFAILLFLMVLLCFRTAWIQIVKGEEYKEIAIEQQTSDIPINAKRGTIYDRNGEILASSTTSYNLWARPAQLKENYNKERLVEISSLLAMDLSMDAKVILEKLTSEDALIKVTNALTKEVADKIKAHEIYGLELAAYTNRLYPLGTTAANLLGSVSVDGIGRSGIEYQYNEYLSGVAGRTVHGQDLVGNLLAFGETKTYDAQDGLNIELTIDEVLQHYLDDAISVGIETSKADKICGIAMDPRTGEILAMSVFPTFNPNQATVPADPQLKEEFDKMTEEEQLNVIFDLWRNPIVNDVYEPGSTFKLITSSATLESALANPNTEYYCGGSIEVYDAEIHDALDAVHGVQTLTQAVGNSCNIIHVQMAQNLGLERFYKYLDLYGFTSKTGIDFPGEVSSIVYDKEDYGPVELATTGFGQGIAITPIQLITAISAIGNDGMLVQPHLVRRLMNDKGETVLEYRTEEVRKVISAATAHEMLSIMEQQVEFYGGTSAKIPGYRMGGKTGTAERVVANSETGYDELYYNTSFVSLVPIDNPQLAVLVVCYAPKEGRFGSAIPVVKDFLVKALPYMNVERTDAEAQEYEEIAYSYVPDITGMTYKEAVEMLTAYGLKYAVRPESSEDEVDDDMDFVVVDQYPKAGERISIEDIVYIYRE
ncbi:MAG: PASTA domain-containing protein [Firmicutes bacterium]|nr:PASTA domain-containing protein [Bacillota bacterium]